MREIKFRYCFEDEANKKHILTETIEEIETYGDIPRNIELGWRLVSRDEYTGLKDKQGTEIYEGDIVKCFEHSAYGWSKSPDYYIIGEQPSYGKIDGTIVFGISFCETSGFDDPGFRRDIEVIGNIYENTKLLLCKEN